MNLNRVLTFQEVISQTDKILASGMPMDQKFYDLGKFIRTCNEFAVAVEHYVAQKEKP